MDCSFGRKLNLLCQKKMMKSKKRKNFSDFKLHEIGFSYFCRLFACFLDILIMIMTNVYLELTNKCLKWKNSRFYSTLKTISIKETDEMNIEMIILMIFF